MTDKVSSGQKLASSPLRKASVVNDVIDAAEDFKRRRLGEGGDAIRRATPTDLVKVRNDTGGDLLPGNVVQLGGYLLDEINKRHLWFEGKTPDGEERLAILNAPLKEDAIGWAHIGGVCVARVDVTDIDHKFAKPDDTTLLVSASDGPFQILSEPSGVSEQEVAVLIRPITATTPYYYAYATSGIDPRNDSTKTFGVSALLTLWKSKDDGTYEETDIETVVYNWSLTAVEEDAFIRVTKEASGIYVVDNADCEAPPEEE